MDDTKRSYNQPHPILGGVAVGCQWKSGFYNHKMITKIKDYKKRELELNIERLKRRIAIMEKQIKDIERFRGKVK